MAEHNITFSLCFCYSYFFYSCFFWDLFVWLVRRTSCSACFGCSGTFWFISYLWAYLYCFLFSGGGFMFKQWKEKYLVLTIEGNLLVCRDAESPPDQVVALHSSCESIAEGREILDLPKLPPGGRRDCCFALILPQNKFLLLLSDNPDDCT